MTEVAVMVQGTESVTFSAVHIPMDGAIITRYQIRPCDPFRHRYNAITATNYPNMITQIWGIACIEDAEMQILGEFVGKCGSNAPR